ncbi:hypothetical protein [Lactovum odontotermitis]
MAKSLKQQFKKLERDLTKEMTKTVNNVNRKMKRNPITLPIDSKLKNGIVVQPKHIGDNITINGNVTQSQIGGKNNDQNNTSVSEIERVLRDIRELSKTFSEEDREQLISILSEIQENEEVIQGENKSFLENHPLVKMGINAMVTFATTSGLEKLIAIIGKVFS